MAGPGVPLTDAQWARIEPLLPALGGDEQTGTTPLQWLLRARVRRAQYLLETTDDPVERVADQAGFGSPAALRERFKRVTGTTPHGCRASFRGQRPTART